MLVHLRFPAGLRVKFKPGQYLNVILPDGERRNFSIANPPRESDGVQLHIRRVPGGAFTGFVFESLRQGAPLRIEVPYPIESKASGIGDRGFHKACWYQRDFDVEATADTRVILHFGAIDYFAKVWVNGHFVASHEGGHTPFNADITDALNASGPQVVTVYVEDDPHELNKPRGKQDWQLEPHSIWYPRTTGIWQTVWIERVARTYVQKIRWTPHVEGFALTFEARVIGDATDGLSMEVQVRHGDRLLADVGFDVVNKGPAEFAQSLKEEIGYWKKIVEETKVKIE